MIQLRPYQDAMIEGVRAQLRDGASRVVLQAPTGAGKTAVMSFMAARAAERRKTTVFVVHRVELLRQASRAFDELGVAHGIIAPGNTQTRDPIQIASINTLVRRLDRVPQSDLLIFDECHHCVAGTWRRLIDAWSDAKMVGLTATPCRLDGRGLDDIFRGLVRGPSVADLIEEGFLAPYQLFAPPIGIDTAAVKSRAGDFAKDQLARAVDKPTITGDAVRHYQRIANGRQAIVFAVSIEHSKHVVAQFRAAGVRAEHLDGNEDDHRRRRVVEAFSRGEIRVLSSVDLFSEGLDVPGAEVAILLRPTQSLSLYLQMVGRVLRPQPGKTAIILDHAGNALRHGLPDDDREWTLQGRTKGDKRPTEPAMPVKQCPSCFACHAPAPLCPACGHVYEAQGRIIQEEEGELHQIDPAELRRRRNKEQAKAQSLEDLIELGQARGYKNPAKWAQHVWGARQRRRSREAA